METSQGSAGGWMDKEIVTCKHKHMDSWMYTDTHTQWSVIQPQKEGNPAIL